MLFVAPEGSSHARAVAPSGSGPDRRNWLEITLPTAVALIVWAAFNFR